jgi:hypothetical protein
MLAASRPFELGNRGVNCSVHREVGTRRICRNSKANRLLCTQGGNASSSQNPEEVVEKREFPHANEIGSFWLLL